MEYKKFKDAWHEWTTINKDNKDIPAVVVAEWFYKKGFNENNSEEDYEDYK